MNEPDSEPPPPATTAVEGSGDPISSGGVGNDNPASMDTDTFAAGSGSLDPNPAAVARAAANFAVATGAERFDPNAPLPNLDIAVVQNVYRQTGLFPPGWECLPVPITAPTAVGTTLPLKLQQEVRIRRAALRSQARQNRIY